MVANALDLLPKWKRLRPPPLHSLSSEGRTGAGEWEGAILSDGRRTSFQGPESGEEKVAGAANSGTRTSLILKICGSPSPPLRASPGGQAPAHAFGNRALVAWRPL